MASDSSDSVEQKPKIQIYATPNNEVTPFWKGIYIYIYTYEYMIAYVGCESLFIFLTLNCFFTAKYEKDAKKYWDVFYKRHQDRVGFAFPFIVII